MASVISAIKDTVPISAVHRGQAGKIFEDVRKNGAKVVMKNNVRRVRPSLAGGIRPADGRGERRQTGSHRAERLAHYDPKTLVSWDEMMQL